MSIYPEYAPEQETHIRGLCRRFFDLYSSYVASTSLSQSAQLAATSVDIYNELAKAIFGKHFNDISKYLAPLEMANQRQRTFIETIGTWVHNSTYLYTIYAAIGSMLKYADTPKYPITYQVTEQKHEFTIVDNTSTWKNGQVYTITFTENSNVATCINVIDINDPIKYTHSCIYRELRLGDYIIREFKFSWITFNILTFGTRSPQLLAGSSHNHV